MGSTYFYLEYLMAFHSLLREYFHNPAIFAVEYSLAPGEQYPVQPTEVRMGYVHVLSVAKSSNRVCVMGDSAGGSLSLNLIGDLRKVAMLVNGVPEMPAFIVLVSPWMTFVSKNHQDTEDDYLSSTALHKFARLYAPDDSGTGVLQEASPSAGLISRRNAMGPKRGYYIWYGDKELLARDIRSTIQTLRNMGISVRSEVRREGGRNVHVWPLISFFLASTQERRLQETKGIVRAIATSMGK